MNNHKVAQALNSLSLAFGELAEAIDEAQPVASSAAIAEKPSNIGLSQLAGPEDDIPFDYADEIRAGTVVPEGSASVCPKHHKPYKESTKGFGPYCTSTSDDPAWSNKRGYCSITPKNAAVWLRAQAAAAA